MAEQTGNKVRNVEKTHKTEAHIMFDLPYNTRLAIPARMAGEILPYLTVLSEEYESPNYVQKINMEQTVQFKLLTAETMTAAHVAALLTKKE